MNVETRADSVAVQGVPQQLRARPTGGRTARAGDDQATGHPLAPSVPPRPTAAGDDHPLTGKQVLVVGINYAPEPTGIAPYTTAMAEHLATRAKLVTVLTGLPHYPSWRVPPAYRGFRRNPEQHTPSLHVVRHKHYVPRRMSALTRGAYEASFWRRAANTALATAPDLVVAVTPSLSGALAGARIARRHGCPLVVLVQDLMARAAAQSGIGGGGAVAGMTAKLEASALTAADRVLIVSDAFRPALHEYGIGDDRIDLVPNWSHVTPSPMLPDQARRALGWPVDRFTVVHTGNMGFKQGLTTVIDAAGELHRRGVPADVILVGDGSQRAALRTLAADLPNVRFIDPVSSEDYPRVLAAADLLLLCERPSVADMSLPSKLTSYLMAGRPVLAAVAPGGATAAELARVGGGAHLVEAGRAWELADAIAVLRLADDRRAAMAVAGRTYADAQLGAAPALRRLENSLVAALPQEHRG